MRRSAKKSEPKVRPAVASYTMNRSTSADGTKFECWEAFVGQAPRAERVGRATLRNGEFVDGWVADFSTGTMPDGATLGDWQDAVEAWVASHVWELDDVAALIDTPEPPRFFLLKDRAYRQTSCSGYSGDAFFKGETVYFEWSAPYVEGETWKVEDTIAVLLKAEGWSLKPVHAGYGDGSRVRDAYAEQQAAGEAE